MDASEIHDGGAAPIATPLHAANNNPEIIREQDQYLPVANVYRCIRTGLPSSAKISHESKDLIQECVSEFCAFVGSEASDKCRREGRKIMSGEDVTAAMKSLGFDGYADVLVAMLIHLRSVHRQPQNEVCFFILEWER